MLRNCGKAVNKFVLKILFLSKLNDKLYTFLHFKLIKQISEGLDIKKNRTCI